MKQPWLKFYSADWRSDVTLGTCSLAARGLWMEMLCIMSEAEPRGSLSKGGKPFTLSQIAALARAPAKEVERLLVELEREEVFSRDKDGTIYSRRMRRDIEKAEADKANGKAGGNPNLKGRIKGGVNPPVKGDDKAQKLEARGQSQFHPSDENIEKTQDKIREDLFLRFWGECPKRVEEDFVRKRFFAIIDAGDATVDEIVDGIKAYARTVAGKDPEWITAPMKWLCAGRWKDGRKPPVSQVVAEKLKRVFVLRDSEAGRAWWDYVFATEGEYPICVDGGWWFPSPFPPKPPEEMEAAE